MTDATPLLQVRNLSVRAGRAVDAPEILRDISFSLESRRILGVIGGGGSGKTTLARGIVNWLAPPLRVSAGQVLFRGRDILTLAPDEARRLRGKAIAYVGGDPAGAMDPTMTVGAQIVEKLRAVDPGVSRREAKERVIALLSAVRIPTPEQRFN